MMSGRTRLQLKELSLRSLVRTVRQPAQLFPALIFPLFLLAINSAGLKAAVHIPGFPTDSYLTFALAVPFIQVGLFGLLNAGTDLARDIETGFMKRLALTPVGGSTLIVGQLSGVVAFGIFGGLLYLAIGLAAGAGFAAGLAGVFWLIALAAMITLAFGCVGIFAALRMGNSEAVQGLFPLFFMFLFLSSMALPRDLIQADWFRMVATLNPVSYLIEGIRSLFVVGIDPHALAVAFAVAGSITVIFLTASALTVRSRLTRT